MTHTGKSYVIDFENLPESIAAVPNELGERDRLEAEMAKAMDTFTEHTKKVPWFLRPFLKLKTITWTDNGISEITTRVGKDVIAKGSY